jgi:hypothetical protein
VIGPSFLFWAVIFCLVVEIRVLSHVAMFRLPLTLIASYSFPFFLIAIDIVPLFVWSCPVAFHNVSLELCGSGMPSTAPVTCSPSTGTSQEGLRTSVSNPQGPSTRWTFPNPRSKSKKNTSEARAYISSSAVTTIQALAGSPVSFGDSPHNRTIVVESPTGPPISVPLLSRAFTSCPVSSGVGTWIPGRPTDQTDVRQLESPTTRPHSVW